MKIYSTFCFLFLLFSFCFADEKEFGPPPIGNFSLPASQQPSGLFAFGGNIIKKDQKQLFLFADDFSGKNRIITDFIPNVLYGITDKVSILLNFPFQPIQKIKGHTSQGPSDFYPQIEFAFYEKSTLYYQDQGTLVVNMTVPTGSLRKNPPTGFGSPSFFIGSTYYRMFVNCFAFACQGVQIMTPHRGNELGNQYLYQFGFGKNLPSSKGWIFAWMVEVDGQYGARNRMHNQRVKNSGGNIIYVTPSLWFSNKNFYAQMGPSIPVIQHWFGKQPKIDLGFNCNLSWSFYGKD